MLEKKFNCLLYINLQLFAEGGGGGEKTEKATPKKRKDAREKGQILQSRELMSGCVLLIMFIALMIYAPYIFGELKLFCENVFLKYMKNVYNPDSISESMIYTYFIDVVIVFIKTSGVLMLVGLVSGVLLNLVQTKFLFTTQTLKFDLKKLNPINGFKRMFSLKSIFELVKSVLKLALMTYVAYSVIKDEIPGVMTIMDLDIKSISFYICSICINIAIRIAILLVILGFLDYAYQWWQYEKNLKMSKHEVKEEFKQMEGDPQIKSKIRQKQREMAMRRMMEDVPSADVVITNPTHFAIALKYEHQKDEAPVVVAKGTGFVALKIKEIANDNNITIVENKLLARALYENVDVGRTIPSEFYTAVADILSYVYNLKKGVYAAPPASGT